MPEGLALFYFREELVLVGFDGGDELGEIFGIDLCLAESCEGSLGDGACHGRHADDEDVLLADEVPEILLVLDTVNGEEGSL